MSRPRGLIAAAILAFASGFGALAVLQHRAFWTGRFDVGNLVQAVWSTARGDPLSVTGLRGDQFLRLGAHVDPVVALLAPLWWVWPDASLLLVLQACAVALGAVPVYLLAERALGSAYAGTGFALAYLLYPPTQWLVLDDFHPVAFATPLLLLAFVLLDRDRLLAFALIAGLACLTKEQVGLTVAAMGLVYAVRRGRRLAGLAIAFGGTLVSLVAITVVVPHFALGDGSPFSGRYRGVGGSLGGIAETMAAEPGTIVAAATQSRDLTYVAELVLPLLGVPLLSPLTALVALPEIALNVLSDAPTQTSVHFHYTATVIPALFAAAILGAARLRRGLGSRLVPRLLVVSATLAGVALGPLPLWRHVPFGSELGTREHVVTRHARAARRAIALVPPGAPVSATNTIGAHLSERHRIFSFPILREATWIVVDTERPSYLDAAAAPVRFRRALERLERDPRVELVADLDGVLVLRRR
ncbi:MAG: DUF2079 domain-containing protein [Gaiella sp.]